MTYAWSSGAKIVLVISLMAAVQADAHAQDADWFTALCGPWSLAAAAAADVDGDDDLDLVFAGGIHRSGENVVVLNNGFGNFDSPAVLQSRYGNTKTFDTKFGDLTGNGSPDIVFVSDRGDLHEVYFNDGFGHFRFGAFFGDRETVGRKAALGDFDRDGNLDIVVVAHGTQDWIYWNSADEPLFRGRTPLGPPQSRSLSVRVADLDGNGRVDVIVATGRGEPNRVFLNDGAGGFLPGRSFGSEEWTTWDIAVGDVNGDGYEDVVTANAGSAYSERGDSISGANYVFLGNGTGELRQGEPFGSGHDETVSVALADLDLDGDLDMIVGSGGGGYTGTVVDTVPPVFVEFHRQGKDANLILLNDGRGSFSPVGSFGAPGQWTRTVLAVDVSGDGYPDIVHVTECGTTAIYLNPFGPDGNRGNE